jgi:DNA repair photolyase
MLAAFHDAGCRTGVLIMPVIPFLTDSEKNLRGIYELARNNKVNMVLPGTLHLRGSTREPFMKMVRNSFPEQYTRINKLYSGSNADDSYKNTLRPLIRRLQNEYGPWTKYVPPEPAAEPLQDQQLRLFI